MSLPGKDLMHPLTAEDLLRVPRGARCELVRGDLKMMTPAGGEHGWRTFKLQMILGGFVLARKLGFVFAAETGFLIERDPDTVRAPDCAYVRADRLQGPIPKGYLPLAPDLAVETLSPDDRPDEVRDKVEQWLRAGARRVWVIDPARRQVVVHRRAEEPVTLKQGDVLDGEDVLPGFRLPIHRLFE